MNLLVTAVGVLFFLGQGVAVLLVVAAVAHRAWQGVTARLRPPPAL